MRHFISWHILFYNLKVCIFGNSEVSGISKMDTTAADVVKHFGLNGWPTKLVSLFFLRAI